MSASLTARIMIGAYQLIHSTSNVRLGNGRSRPPESSFGSNAVRRWLPRTGDVHHTLDAARVPYANLPYTGTHIVERLPVGRLKAGLDLPELEARFLPGVFWECQEIVVGRPYPTDLFSSPIEPACIK